MIKVVGIRFQRAGKIYYFDPLDYDLETAMHVIVETARGIETVSYTHLTLPTIA